MDVLLDVRCLQDANYAERGIGRHALTLLRHARDTRVLAGSRFLGLTDPDLPPLSPTAQAMLTGVRETAYTGAMDRPACFVSLSPMTHEALFTARLLHHPGIVTAAVVYDFIPLDEPDRYLSQPSARLDYHVSLRWLARHDLFAPISQAAADRLDALLRVPKQSVTVTGAALDPAFETAAGAGSHVLVIGGGDPRKNPECAVRAHASSVALQGARVPLVITGAYSAEWTRHVQALAASLGGAPGLVRVPGHVAEAELHGFYKDALCVIAPSRAEGFGLPVVEAMASGVPVLASRIPAHAELVGDGELFGPDDDAALSDLLDRMATDLAWREAVVARQALVWPQYRGAAVAGRFWSALAARVPARAPAAPRGARARVALLSPVPPAQSGVADYTGAMCEALGERVDLHVFTATPSPSPLAGAATVRPHTALPHLSSEFDRVVSVMGNSEHHVAGLVHLLRYGGACIAHDARMLDVYHAFIGHDRTRRLAERELGRPLAKGELASWVNSAAAPRALLLGELAVRSEPFMAHSAMTVDLVRERYGTDAVRLPFCQYRPWGAGQLSPAARLAARCRLGIAPGRVRLASFGFVHASKGPLDLIWALDLLRGWGLDADLQFVGACIMDRDPVMRLVTELRLEDFVTLPQNFVTEAAYRDHILAADIGVQLRTVGLGSVSGALADCVGAGLPCVASAGLADAIDAPGYVRRVPGHPSPVLVAEAAMELINAGMISARPEAARLAYAATHGFDTYAARLCEALGLS